MHIQDTSRTNITLSYSPPLQIRQQDFPSVTTSMIKYSPKRSDNGMEITCRAVNPEMAGSALEDTVQLRVMCKFCTVGGKTLHHNFDLDLRIP